MNKFEIIISSPPDRERLVAEIWYDDMFWAEIFHEYEEEPLAIQFFSHPKEKYWEFPLEDALSALQKAKQKLSSMGSTEMGSDV